MKSPEAKRRRLVTGLVLGGASLVAVIVWVTTLFVSSPRQAAANASPPPPSLVAVPVESRVVGEEIVTRGTVVAERSVNILADREPSDADVAVISGHLPSAGTRLDAGEVAVEVSGRPVFVLPGRVPMYRSMKPGMRGPDVEQLRKALNKLGYAAGKGRTYDTKLAKAVALFYSDRSYDPPGLDSREPKVALQAARDTLDDAKTALAEAKRAVSAAKSGEAAAHRQLKTARSELSLAKRALADAVADPDGIRAQAVRDAKATVSTAEADLAAAKEQTRQARASVSTARRLVERSSAALDSARLDAATPLPRTELVFVSSLPISVAKVSGTVGGSVEDAEVLVTSGSPVIRTSISESQRGLIPDGAKVELTSEVLGETAEAHIGEAGDAEGMLMIGPDEPLDGAWIGQDVRVRIVGAQTPTPVLAVPLSAVMIDGSGYTEVVAVDPKATTLASANPRHIRVTTGAQGGGWVEVVPEQPGELSVGDAVAIAGVS